MLNQIVEQSRLSRLQRLKFLLEELLLSPAHLFTLAGVNVESVIRNRQRLCPHVIDPPLHVHVLTVVDEVLQVVGVAALAAVA